MIKTWFVAGTNYYQADLNALFAAIMQDGVVSGFAVAAHSPNNLSVDVPLGSGFKAGLFLNSDATVNALITSNASGYARIDVIAADLDNNAIAVVQGTPSSSPTPPVLTGNKIVLALVTVGNNVSVINPGNIADARVYAMATGVPAGKVDYFAMSTPPAGYLKCNGALISRTTYARLFAAIGTTFGVGDGTTTFGLPDLRGQFARGYDDGAGVDSGRVFGSSQADGFGSHSHNAYALPETNAASGSTTRHLMSRIRDAWTGLTSQATWDGTAGEQSGIMNTGISETRPKNVALLACIKY